MCVIKTYLVKWLSEWIQRGGRFRIDSRQELVWQHEDPKLQLLFRTVEVEWNEGFYEIKPINPWLLLDRTKEFTGERWNCPYPLTLLLDAPTTWEFRHEVAFLHNGAVQLILRNVTQTEREKMVFPDSRVLWEMLSWEVAKNVVVITYTDGRVVEVSTKEVFIPKGEVKSIQQVSKQLYGCDVVLSVSEFTQWYTSVMNKDRTEITPSFTFRMTGPSTSANRLRLRRMGSG